MTVANSPVQWPSWTWCRKWWNHSWHSFRVTLNQRCFAFIRPRTPLVYRHHVISLTQSHSAVFGCSPSGWMSGARRRVVDSWATSVLVGLNTVKCHYNACHYNANASLTRSILGSQTAPTCPHNHPQVAQHMGKRCEIIAVWSATAAMTPLCSHTNGIKQRYPTCWLCQYSRFMIDLRSNTQIHLRCYENAIIWPIWLLDARMFKTIPVAMKLR